MSEQLAITDMTDGMLNREHTKLLSLLRLQEGEKVTYELLVTISTMMRRIIEINSELKARKESE